MSQPGIVHNQAYPNHASARQAVFRQVFYLKIGESNEAMATIYDCGMQIPNSLVSGTENCELKL